MAGCDPQRSWIPDSRDDVTEDWARSLLVSHFGDGVRVRNFRVADSQEPVDHCCELVVAFDCSFDSTAPRAESPPPLSALLEDCLVFTACVDEDERNASAADQTVIQELESVTLPEGADGSVEEEIELLVTSEVDGSVTTDRRPSFYISDSDEEAEAALPALVSYPASGGPSPRAPSPADSESDDQVPDKHLVWKVRLPTSDPLAQLLSVDGLAVDRELTLFSLVAPRLSGVAAPSCVYSEKDCGDSRRWVLVSEDPRRLETATIDPRQPLDDATIASVIDALAKNAALFLMLRRQVEVAGRHISDEYSALRPSDLELGRHPLAADHAGQCLRELAQILSARRPELSEWLLAKASGAMTSFLRLSQPDEDLGIPVNGLCCPQNLHIGDEGVVILDWHLFRYAGLTFDLAHLLLTSVPLDRRRLIGGSLLHDFIRKIRETLEELNEPTPAALTEERVAEDYEQSRGAAFFWAVTDLCRRLSRLSAGATVRRRSGCREVLSEADAGNTCSVESSSAGESELSAAHQSRDDYVQRTHSECSDDRSPEVSDRHIPREYPAPVDYASGVDHADSGEGRKRLAADDSCTKECKDLELKEVLLQRLVDMVLEVKEVDVL